MPIIDPSSARTEEGYPGVTRTVLVDTFQGAQSLYIAQLTINPGAQVTTHIHPDSEEAMTIVDGELEAILGDEVVVLSPGDTVLAPAGVKHGFVNRSEATAALVAAFPNTHFERVTVD
jgi:quercetin dioxygenase-like cupin family protein